MPEHSVLSLTVSEQSSYVKGQFSEWRALCRGVAQYVYYFGQFPAPH